MDGKCPDCGREVKPAKEEAYFFRMSKYAPKLIEHINQHPEFIQPVSRKNEMMNNFLLPGLQDLCVSRTTFSWGIPVDFDPKHVTYVWLDALTNYITGIGYDCGGSSTDQFKKYWPADLHLIGKDIIVISWELMVERMNSDLANILGNLVNRTISMSNKYFDGVIADKGAAGEVDEDLKKVVLEEVKKADAKMEQLRVADAMTEIFNIFRRCNKYIDETTPWTLAKDEAQKDRLSTVLYNLTESIAIGASLLYSFMPGTAGKILAQLNTVKRELSQMDSFGLYPSGSKVTDKPEILFARMDVKEVLDKVEAMQAAQAAGSAAADGGAQGMDAGADGSSGAGDDVIDIEAKPEITYDDFAKLQFQVGEIIQCEAVPKSKKLLCSQVRIGSQTRQILSGIKAYYSPEEMVGKKVMVVTNLKPAKLAGMLSEGMILCAEDAEGNLALMKPEKDMPAGAEIC